MRQWLTVVTAVCVAGVVLRGGEAPLPPLEPATSRAWVQYVQLVEARRAREESDAQRFLAVDFLPHATSDWTALRAGSVVVSRAGARAEDADEIDVPGGLVHHWRGAVLIRGASLADLMRRLRQGPPPQADVLQARVLAREPEAMRVFLRIRRTKIVTVVFDTEHDVRFVTYDNRRAASTTRAVAIAEVDAPGTPDERHVPAETDHDLLWRLQAYWRYLAVPEGVVAECESLSLSRGVPFGLRTISRPLINSAARESMTAALTAVRDAMH
jgi:hypothetical protein